MNYSCLLSMQVTLEATHHGPLTNSPTMFVEIGKLLDFIRLSLLKVQFCGKSSRTIAFQLFDIHSLIQ